MFLRVEIYLMIKNQLQSMFQYRLKIKPSDSDLNQVSEKIIKEVENKTGGNIRS